MTLGNTNKNNFENNETPKVASEKVEEKEISQEEFSNWADSEKESFKKETAEGIEKSNSVNLDDETFEKIKNETGVERKLSAIDKEAEQYINEARGQNEKSEIVEEQKIKDSEFPLEAQNQVDGNLEKKENEPPFYVNEIQQLYIDLANKYLKEENQLKKVIIDYYSNTEKLTEELSNVFKGKSESEIKEKIEEVKKRFENPAFFIEHNQKIHERTATFNRTREREINNPIATEDEYDIGAYKEALETQVRDAVFILQKKGYKTFQSGFREKEGDRRQYVDMYNKKVNLSESFLKSFKEKGFEISPVNDSDRTTIYINPINEKPVNLDEWKKIWDEFAQEIPKAEEEDFGDIKRYSLYTEFRKKQDLLKTEKRN